VGPWQFVEQHSLFSVQCSYRVKQEPPAGGAQCPLEQLPEQHWLESAHADGTARHSPDRQIPPLHVNPEQHGWPSTHASPPATQKILVAHWPGLPAPRLQLFEQQSVGPVHESPLWPQSGGGGGS
jgi:hypothetical protein